MVGSFLFRRLRTERSAEALAPPDIDGDLCVHAHLANATCRRCGQSCPHGAIEFSDCEITLDAARCEGCGLCAPACPQGAISRHGDSAMGGEASLFAACDRVAAPLGDGVLPCLHALGLNDLIRAWLAGARELRVAHGKCDDCTRGGHDRFYEAVNTANAMLGSRGLANIEVSELDAQEWRNALAAVRARRGVDPRRRRFLKHWLNEAIAPVAGKESEPVAATPAVPHLPDAPAAVFAWVPAIDELACTACDACTRICPTGALYLIEDALNPAYATRPEACTGCAMCRDVCEEQAVRVDALRAASRKTIHLSPGLCRACGASYRVPSAEADDEFCRVCRLTQRHRLLYQVIHEA